MMGMNDDDDDDDDGDGDDGGDGGDDGLGSRGELLPSMISATSDANALR